MNYSSIKYYDIANGDGVRTSLFVSGCTNHCKNCFNPETWDFNYGKKFTDDTIQLILDSLKPKYINGLSLLGGDPMHIFNQKEVSRLIDIVKENFKNKDIWLWTGYLLEDLQTKKELRTPFTDRILSNINYLIDGKFIEELKDITLKWRGSSNQRVFKKINNNFTKIL